MSIMLVDGLYQGIQIFMRVIEFAIFAYCIASWIVRPDAPIYRLLERFVWPFISPFRPIGAYLMRMGLRIDLSPFIAIIALQFLNGLIMRLYGLIIGRMGG